ncbi:MAG: DUF4339 domain-containing protein [Thermoguttaceae bacterium]|nr:DUF4339 domain-containing protein [Thermoguttaceae bacterium]
MANWYYYNNGQKTGPVSASQLKQMALEGIIQPNTIIETESGQRAPASSVSGLSFAKEETAIPVGTLAQTEPQTTETQNLFSTFSQKTEGHSTPVIRKQSVHTSDEIPRGFFFKTAKLIQILEYVALSFYWIYMILLIIAYLRMLYLYFNPPVYGLTITGLQLLAALFFVIFPSVLLGISLYIIWPLAVQGVRLMGKFNRWLDNQN